MPGHFIHLPSPPLSTEHHNFSTYPFNHHSNTHIWQGIQRPIGALDNETSINSHPTQNSNIHYIPFVQGDQLRTNQACLPPQLGLSVQMIVNDHPHIPWNTGIDSQPWLDDTIPSFTNGDSNATHDVSDLVTQDLFAPDCPSLAPQNSSLTSFNFPGGPANVTIPIPQPITQTQTVPATSGTLPTRAMPCSIPWCTKTFRRKHEQVRHEASVHGINQGVHRCQVIGCPSHGRGFSRRDKLTEHMWKKHADLGFVKRVL